MIIEAEYLISKGFTPLHPRPVANNKNPGQKRPALRRVTMATRPGSGSIAVSPNKSLLTQLDF